MSGHIQPRSIRIFLSAWLLVTVWVHAGYAAVPAAPLLRTPSGNVADPTPTYRWNRVAGATAYQLWVADSTGIRISRWYRATTAGCATGTGVCRVTPDVVLAPGVARWKVRTRNADGLGRWSTIRRFTVNVPVERVENVLERGDHYDYVSDDPAVEAALFRDMWRVLHESNAPCWISQASTLTQYQFYTDPSFLPGPLYRYSGIDVSVGRVIVHNIGWYFRAGQSVPLKAAYVNVALGDILLVIVDDDTIAEAFWHNGTFLVVTLYDAGNNCL